MPRLIIKETNAAVSALREQLSELKDELDTKIKDAADHAALQKVHDLSTSILDRIEKQFRTALILVTGLIGLLGAGGYFGMQGLVSSAVKDRFDTSIIFELNKQKAIAEGALKEIQTAKAAVKASPLIVLQTDYGSTSSYMGTLKGVIYDINPFARIDIITDGIQDFNVLQAA